MSGGHRNRGMSPKVAQSLGYGREPRYGPETVACPKCSEGTLEICFNKIGQTVEQCVECGYSKLHRGHLTTE